MNSMTFIGDRPDPMGRSSRDCLWHAVQSLRGLGLQPAASVHESCADMVRAEAEFRIFLMLARLALGARVPYFAHPGDPYLTRDERRLLRALAAAQADNPWLLDNYLYPIALDREARHHLAEAVGSLATALGTAGFVLARLPTRRIPAAALRVAFAHGLTVEEIDVTWPGRVAD